MTDTVKTMMTTAGVDPEMLPFTNVIYNAGGTHPQPTAKVRFANQGIGDAPLVAVSLDSRDAKLYARDVARAELICLALNNLLAAAPKAEPVSDPYKLGEGEVLQWADGYPEKFRSGEWFIALTAWNDRVCLKALPEEYSYDFTTADGTYIKADKIVKWMPFPDSEFRHPAAPAAPKVEQEPVRWQIIEAADDHLTLRDDDTNREVVVDMVALLNPAPASDELLEALEDARRKLSYAGQDACSEAAAQSNCNQAYHIISGLIAKHKGPQS